MKAQRVSNRVFAKSGAVGALSKADTGQPWVVLSGTWARDTNGLYLSVVEPGWRYAMVYSGLSNCVISADIKYFDDCGLCFRLDDDVDNSGNFFNFVIDSTSLTVRRTNAWTQVDIGAYSFTPVVGTTYNVTLVLNGSSIRVYLDKTLCLNLTDTFNMTFKNYGLWSEGAVNTNRWSSFEVRPLAHVSSLAVSDDFERTTVLTPTWRQQYSANIWSANTSTAKARTGTRSLRFELRSTDPLVSDSIRSELELIARELPADYHTYSFSTYLPGVADGAEEYLLDPASSEIICQWHNTPDPTEEWTSPPLLLRTGAYSFVEGDHYSIQVHWDPGARATDLTIQNQVHDLGSYTGDKGHWVDWVFIVKWGWLDSQNPFIQIYKDGVKILDRPGLNTTNDQVGIGLQFGIYKWDWGHPENGDSILTNRVIYHDNVVIT